MSFSFFFSCEWAYYLCFDCFFLIYTYSKSPLALPGPLSAPSNASRFQYVKHVSKRLMNVVLAENNNTLAPPTPLWLNRLALFFLVSVLLLLFLISSFPIILNTYTPLWLILVAIFFLVSAFFFSPSSSAIIFLYTFLFINTLVLLTPL